MHDFAGSSAPSGYLLCDGSAVSRTSYADLFAVIGETWGAGDGSTTFNLPDMRGRVAVGSGTGTGLTARALAETFGEEEHTITEGETGSHAHTSYGTTTGRASGSSNFRSMSTSASSNLQTSVSGGDEPHNNIQPSAVVTKIIKT
ncbi:MAG: tail fiber protein [Alphaproteobacteria bacterium]